MKIILSVLLFCTAVLAGDDYFCRLDRIVQEPRCSQAGGTCTFAEDCAHPTEERGLCPSQRSQGVECCYGISTRETRCQKNGGECFSASRFCAKKSIYKRATDCASDEKCCILV